MKKTTSPTETNLINLVYSASIILAGLAAIKMLKKGKGTANYKFDANDKVPFIPGTNPFKSDVFYKLRLSKQQFDTLRNFPGKLLVFQFFYPSDLDCGSPTLFVYKRKEDRSPTGTPPVILSYDNPSGEPIKGRSQVLGDQQIKIKALENLIEKATGSADGTYSYLIFDPLFMPDNPHLAYRVSVDGGGSSATLNPSPPA